MDHAFWPFVTTRLYLDQTGDMEVLFEKVPYFKDLQSMRGTAHDKFWNSEYGQKQKTERDHIYFGTVLEHILLQNLCAFYDVGEHNEMRLHGADWNDALDMAWEKGESVAFTCAYAGNLRNIAKHSVSWKKSVEAARLKLHKRWKIFLQEAWNCMKMQHVSRHSLQDTQRNVNIISVETQLL